MAITQPLVLQCLLASGPGSGVNGLSYPLVANAIATGFYSWIINPANFQFIGVSTGTGPGTGIVDGIITVVPNSSIILANMVNTGPAASFIASAIANGISLVFSSGAAYKGIVTGVYTGSDIVQTIIINNPLTLITAIYSALGSVPTSFNFCASIGNGISQMLAFITGTGIITPTTTVGTVPSVGASISSIV